MEALIETFHLDAGLLIAQLINFAIVILVLYFFAVKPLTKVMAERTKKIEKSLEDAKKIDEKMEAMQNDYKKTVAQAKKEANDILEKAQEQAEVKRKEMITKTKEEIGQIINEEKVKMQQEKAAVLKEIKADVANLVIASVEKVLEKKMDTKEDNKLIKEMIK